MRKLLNVIFLILISLAVIHAQSATGRVNGEVWFRPFVRNINGFENRGLPNCEVVFQSNVAKKQIVTDDKGHYSVDLPEGTYESKVTCPENTGMSGEFHPSVRSGLVVKPKMDTLIN